MVDDACAAKIISRGPLQLGISRGSPEQVIDGWRYFGYEPAKGENDADMGRRKALEFLDKLKGAGFAQPNPYPMFPNPPGLLRLEPHSEGLRERIWWGAASNATAIWAAENGHSNTVEALLEHGAEIDLQDRSGMTALMTAVIAGRVKSVKALLERGADPGIKDSTGAAALDYAKKTKQVEMIDLLKKSKK